jgi:hypothetical protein
LNRTPWLPPANAATLPFQCVGQLISCMRGFVIHVIPREILWGSGRALAGPPKHGPGRPRRRMPDVIGKCPRAGVFVGF